MTYANPVWRRGLDRAVTQLRSAGVKGLIVPDLSLEDSAPWRRATRGGELDLVLIAAPGGTSPRVRAIARATRGFLYLVSRYGTTGAGRTEGASDLSAIVRTARAARPGLPILVGFGVRGRPSARVALSTGADGVIVGTALEEKLASGAEPGEITRWLRSFSTLPRAAGPAH
jgi:tryptophan synthase alpha chain